MRLRNKPWVKAFLIQNEQFLLKWESNTPFIDLNHVFSHPNPVHLEIGSGKGNFISTLALLNPQINYIGMEKETTVVGVALKKTIELFKQAEKQNTNLKYFNYFAEDLSSIFQPLSIDKIYLNFSDPWPKTKHETKRLMHIKFLQTYAKILKLNGEIEFKTDNDKLFAFALEQVVSSPDWAIISQTNDLYNNKKMLEFNIQSEYETKFHNLGKNINKMIIQKIK